MTARPFAVPSAPAGASLPRAVNSSHAATRRRHILTVISSAPLLLCRVPPGVPRPRAGLGEVRADAGARGDRARLLRQGGAAQRYGRHRGGRGGPTGTSRVFGGRRGDERNSVLVCRFVFSRRTSEGRGTFRARRLPRLRATAPRVPRAFRRDARRVSTPPVSLADARSVPVCPKPNPEKRDAKGGGDGAREAARGGQAQPGGGGVGAAETRLGGEVRGRARAAAGTRTSAGGVRVAAARQGGARGAHRAHERRRVRARFVRERRGRGPFRVFFLALNRLFRPYPSGVRQKGPKRSFSVCIGRSTFGAPEYSQALQ